MAGRCKVGLASVASVVVCTALVGCSETLSLADLPNITRLPTKLLSKEEQAKTMNGMLERGQTHQAEAAKAIEAVRIEDAATLNAAKEGEKAR